MLRLQVTDTSAFAQAVSRKTRAHAAVRDRDRRWQKRKPGQRLREWRQAGGGGGELEDDTEEDKSIDDKAESAEAESAEAESASEFGRDSVGGWSESEASHRQTSSEVQDHYDEMQGLCDAP